MKTFGITLIVIGFALSVLPASAQGQTSYTLETHTEGAGGYFTLEGQTARNPTLAVADGQTITITIKGMDDGVHNFCVGSECSEYVTAVAETQTFTFTAGPTTTEYHCQPHKAAGMKGALTTGTTTTPPATTPSGGEANNTPGVQVLGVSIALVGAALLMGRRTK